MSDSVWPHRWQPTRLPSLGFSRQEHWSGLPFPSPMHDSEKWKWSRSVVWLFETPWTAAHQAPPSMGFSRQEYWSGVPVPSPFTTLDTWYKWNYEALHWPNGSFWFFLNMLWKTWMNLLANPIFVFLNEWLIAHITMFLKFIYVVTYGRLSLIFYGWIILHCMYILYSLYPFIQRWTFGSFYISQSWIMLH